MKIHYFLFLTYMLTTNSNFIMNPPKISIYLSEYRFSFTPQKEICLDTLTTKIEDGKKLKITLFDCKGRMHLECFKNNIKIEEGDYINSLDLLKKYVNTVNGINGKEKIRIYEFYQPLRTGVWSFYDKKGHLIHKEIYKEGIVQK